MNFDGAGNAKTKTDSNFTIEAGKAHTVNAGSKSTINVGGDASCLKMDKDGIIDLTSSGTITLKVGSSTITISDGEIKLKSTQIDINGTTNNISGTSNNITGKNHLEGTTTIDKGIINLN